MNLYGHYVVINDEIEYGLDFFRYNIVFFSLTMYNDK